MEKFAQAAKAAYEDYSEEDKEQIMKAFKLLDKNGDGTISLGEFLKYYKEFGGDPDEKRQIFNLVDQNCDGSLQFSEFLTLCHLITIGRPISTGCDKMGLKSASIGSGSKRKKVKKAFRGLVGILGVAANIIGLGAVFSQV